MCASLGMAAVIWVTTPALESVVGTYGLGEKAVTALGPIALGLATYLGLCWVLRVGELRELVGVARSRLTR
jgi:hypothetical protein